MFSLLKNTLFSFLLGFEWLLRLTFGLVLCSLGCHRGQTASCVLLARVSPPELLLRIECQNCLSCLLVTEDIGSGVGAPKLIVVVDVACHDKLGGQTTKEGTGWLSRISHRQTFHMQSHKTEFLLHSHVLVCLSLFILSTTTHVRLPGVFVHFWGYSLA